MIEKIRGKFHFFKYTYYTHIDQLYEAHRWTKNLCKSHLNLQAYVTSQDSITDLQLSLTNVRHIGNTIYANPSLIVSDMVTEIEEVDLDEEA